MTGKRTLEERRAINAALSRALRAAEDGSAYARDIAVIELVRLLGAAEVLKPVALEVAEMERREPVVLF
jgi:hypothetical protein